VTTPSPCDPNPCTDADEPTCQDGTTLLVYDEPGDCAVDGEGDAACTYPSRTVNCAATGGTCSAGACVGGARAPAAGEVIFTEVLYDTVAPLDDTKAEWFELTNLADDALALDGCTFSDAQSNQQTVSGLVLAANGRALFARVAEPAQNGGLTPDATFGFALNNSGTERLTLTCAGVVVDTISWAASAWPEAISLSLDPGAFDATANDDSDNWCLGAGVYYEGDAGVTTDDHLGTPGAANPDCPVPDTTVDWCRYQWPLDTTAAAGTPFTAMGRVYEAGLTDLTTGVDEDADLVAAAGYGPDGSDPAVDAGWTWVPADGNPAWVDTDEPNNDEYMATFPAPAVGTYDLAFRFSVDGGATWLYCDDAAEGSTDGYAAANAGALVTEPSPCDPNPCTTAPAAECTDGVTLVTYGAPGTCTVDGTDAVCDWPETTTNCALTGGTCSGGACVGGARAPAVGEIVITEIMFDTNSPLDEAAAEWVELHNVTAEALQVAGCTLTDGAPTVNQLATFTIPAGGFALLGRSADSANFGGVAPAATFSLALNNAGDSVVLTCAAGVIDAVTFDGTFPHTAGYSIQLDPGAYDAAANDAAASWCLAAADDVYFAGSGAAEQHYGTPAAANADCVAADTVVDWCRLQWPLDEAATAGAAVTVYGRVWDEGLTDRTTGVDAEPGLVGQAGYGPDASEPADNAAWTWFAAAGNPAWVDTEEPNNDEYQATFAAPAAGTYDLAYRFSLDGGTTWLYCDRKVGTEEATDGSADGYQPANAGSLTTTASGARAPVAGELIVTEIMYDTNGALSENTAEWIELANVSDAPLTLDGCDVVDGSATPTPASLAGLIVAPDGRVLLAKSPDPAANGGLTPQATFTFSLNNGGDTVTVRCDGTVIDAVTYGGDGWPGAAPAHALSLDPGAHTAVDNDAGLSWCLAATADLYYDGATEADDHFGTPGETNPACPEVDTVVDWCRFQHPLAAEVLAGEELTAYGRFWDEGLTDQTTGNDPWATLAAQVGYGPDGSDPSVDATGWTWLDAVPNASWNTPAVIEANNDEYQSTFAVEATGTYDLAFRFSLDLGETWLYCDRKVGTEEATDGSSDGYQPANAGSLTVTASVCVPNPCTVAPAAECAPDGVTLVTYDAPGLCTPDGGSYTCDWPETTTDCSPGGGTCVVDRCEGGARAPLAAGELVITEILYDTDDPLAETSAEWFEVVNTTADALNLDGCQVGDDADSTTIADLVVAPGAYALFVRSDVAADNGGLIPDHLFGFSLVNGGDTIAITCDTTVIDTVTYDDGGAFPNGRAVAIQLDPELVDWEFNDEGEAWCLATESYYTAATSPAGDHYGSPGLENPPCHDAVAWCRLQWPVDEGDVTAGTPFTVYGRLWEAGITDVTTATDPHPIVTTSVGYGPDDSDPSADPTGWTFTAATPNIGFTGADLEADNDEYMGTFNAPAAGTYDFAFRVSLDGGRSWTYCDRDVPPEHGDDDGSADGYQPANAGSLTTVAGAMGTLLFSEYVEGSSNNKAVEIWNGGADEVLLSSCSVRYYTNGSLTVSATLPLNAVTLAPGATWVLCHSSFRADLAPTLCDQLAGLNINGDDAIALDCQGTTMDVIGVIGVDPGSEWGTGVLSTADNTIRRLCSVADGNPDGWAAPFDPASEWEGFATDDFSDLGTHCP